VAGIVVTLTAIAKDGRTINPAVITPRRIITKRRAKRTRIMPHASSSDRVLERHWII